MGIYIPSMEMPTSCHKCQLNVVGYCIIANRVDRRTSFVTNDAIQTWCPLVSVPTSHGRLGDLDALIEKCEEMADKEDGNQLDALVLLKWFLEQNVPTIIPASEESTQ